MGQEIVVYKNNNNVLYPETLGVHKTFYIMLKTTSQIQPTQTSST